VPDVATASLAQVFGDVDQNGKTRLVVLDPRRWTLQNGRDTPTRADITALLGVGPQALPVDNGASCVVACTSAQRRDNARKRATEVLAWKAVIGQLDPDDDKRSEALAEYRSAADRVDSDLLKAFQRFAYLTRTDRVEVDLKRFDDDTKSSLKGSHVWDALADNGRAVFPGRLSGEYLRTLIAKVPRTLTLKEIGQQFYKNAVGWKIRGSAAAPGTASPSCSRSTRTASMVRPTRPTSASPTPSAPRTPSPNRGDEEDGDSEKAS